MLSKGTPDDKKFCREVLRQTYMKEQHTPVGRTADKFDTDSVTINQVSGTIHSFHTDKHYYMILKYTIDMYGPALNES